MAQVGFGLSRETVTCLAFKIVDATQQKHPFKDRRAGRAWFDGFCCQHPKLSIRSPLPLSYCRKGKTHTILTCVSASDFVLPPMVIFPVNNHLRLIFV